MKSSKSVFVSYSHDSPEHADAVLELTNRLRSEGIDCVLDQYETSPREGWPRWMDREIKKARFVVMICTEKYYKRVMGEEEKGIGLGVKWEGSLIYNHLYSAESLNDKFIPVLFHESDKIFIPTPLQGATLYIINNNIGYQDLCFRLLEQPKIKKPPLGKKRKLPEKKIKTDVAMFLSTPIDLRSWDEAQWQGMFYLFAPGLVPVLGLVFRNELPAKKIFQDWNRRYGRNDEYEELRISIIEGDIPGEDPGYSVHIGADPEQAMKNYLKHGFQANKDFFMLVSRFRRMESHLPLKNLDTFKMLYRQNKSYILAPGLISSDGKNMKPILDLGIHKRVIYFKNSKEIGANDIDFVVLKPASLALTPEKSF